MATPVGRAIRPVALRPASARPMCVFLARHGRGHRSRRPRSTTAPTSTRSSGPASPTSSPFPPAGRSGANSIPACSCSSISSSIARSARRPASSARVASRMSPFAHPIAPEPAPAHRRRRPGGGHRVPVRRNLRLHGGAAILDAAESLLYQAQGADVIGMTAATEAKLAREAEISYATIAMVTDYDCWHEEHGAGRRRLGVESGARKRRPRQRAGRARARRFPRRARALSRRSDRALGRRHHDPPSARGSRAHGQARRRSRTRVARGVLKPGGEELPFHSNSNISIIIIEIRRRRQWR